MNTRLLLEAVRLAYGRHPANGPHAYARAVGADPSDTAITVLRVLGAG